MTVHPAFGHTTGTLVNALLGRYGDSIITSPELRLRPGIVHRLDRETSGVIVCAKTESALVRLQEQFHDRETKKLYIAVTIAPPQPKDGTVNAPIGRNPKNFTKMSIRFDGDGKPALTIYRTLGTSEGGALVAAYPKTGRTHQIRLHLKSKGATVFFDEMYGTPDRDSQILTRLSNGETLPTPRHLLHAAKLGFYHPLTGSWLECAAPLPEDLIRAWDIIRGKSEPSATAALETASRSWPEDSNENMQ
jgi:23S rRNA pseudouridine1911/1915/1917 synthase